MPKFKPIAEIEKEAALKSATFPLIDNDRPLDETEVEAEQKAVRFSLAKYNRIKPIPGTLGFLLRNIRGGNEAVMNFLEETEDNGKTRKFIREFNIIWKLMDEFSKKRVDIFDILCIKYNVNKKKFWGALQEGMFDNNDALAASALSGYKPDFVELLIKLAKNSRNHQDRKLLAQALGITKDTPLISITDNSRREVKNVQVNIGNVPSFASSIRRTEKNITKDNSLELEEGKEQLALGEGNKDYIDTEFSVVEEQEMIESKVA